MKVFNDLHILALSFTSAVLAVCLCVTSDLFFPFSHTQRHLKEEATSFLRKAWALSFESVPMLLVETHMVEK